MPSQQQLVGINKLSIFWHVCYMHVALRELIDSY
jgi:hypothetical protein